MNSSVNRFAESPEPSSEKSPTSPNVSNPTAQSPPASSSTAPSPAIDGEQKTASPRKHPIPPPSEPRQNRAIGLVRGLYEPSDELLTRGQLTTTDGTAIDAVLLGRVISLVKNHLDLNLPHLWVVYPRTRMEDSGLHVQIAGVWEPEVLDPKPDELPATDSPTEDSATVEEESSAEDSPQTDDSAPAMVATPPKAPKAPNPAPDREEVEPIRDGYFSLRGEVIFYSQEEKKAVIKIQQSPKRDSDKAKYFKLNLQGAFPKENVLGHFWDLQVMLEGSILTIEKATDIGLMPIKKRNKKFDRTNRKSSRPKFARKNQSSSSYKPSTYKPSTGDGATPKPSTFSKPIRRGSKKEES
ncbi:hypothetical protein IQ249_05420 [Lusitaniella coriacea LEGE 07157]|uniref:Uncharacterized protein n=1 Tax=Lusitaniella coriacea LEGE 07157 TaxID=945747 RepID=A0A8J7B127_9CYAN|nr:hypothetical protein [Lusitaniella coriacea]MBE9115335.1 hypothetical protein [Lusitaniella coriacea LEGE 07157]